MLPAPSASTAPEHRRADIQVLRAWAVMLVLVFHAHLGLARAGYLGVDMFFVVSGFLITGLIARGIEQERFSLVAFYLRRAKRLLPAAYTVFLVTLVLGAWWLTTQELQNLVRQVAGAVTFTANVVLWRQSGYFEGAAHLKPLLHTWSLSVEEQYYFCLPLLLLWLPARWWRHMVVALLVLSLAGAVWFRGREFAFYLLPFRAWELMLGSLGALAVRGTGLSRSWQQLIRLAFWPAMLTLLALPWIGWRLDGFDTGALAVCVATLVVILRQHPWLNRTDWVWMPVKVGDMSYSLYLVHWPLFALFNNAWLSGSPGLHAAWGIGLLTLAVMLGYALHTLVERPVLNWPPRRNRLLVKGLLAGSVALLLAAVATPWLVRPATDYVQRLRVNPGLSPECEYRTLFSPLESCRTAHTPVVLVWGDSFAMHLAPGLADQAQARGLGLIQATRSECAGLLGLATLKGGRPQAWGHDCMAFNDSVLDWLRQHPEVQTVVLSSPYDQYLGHSVLWRESVKPDAPQSVELGDTARLLQALSRTADVLHAMGKRVVVISPPPFTGAATGVCVERLERGLPTILARPDCDLEYEPYLAHRRAVIDLLDQLPSQTGLPLLRIDRFLCQPAAGRCAVKLDDVYLYQADGAHLTYEGSRELAHRMHWLDAVLPTTPSTRP